MDAQSRAAFNRNFTPEKYARFLSLLDQRCGTHVGFRNSETPCFLPRAILDRMVTAGEELILQLVENPAYRAASDASIPPAWNAPGESARPLFVCADFGLTRDLEPKLVGIQGFPSLFAYQPILADTYRVAYGIPGANLLVAEYWGLLRQAVVGEHAPEDVALLGVDPYKQKALADFLLTKEQLGVRIVNITQVEKRGRKLWARGRPIERIYNRMKVDELVRKNIRLPFDLRDPLDVEWAGHPNWYFRISEFSLPYLNHPSVPKTIFPNEANPLPDDLENWVLKPLVSLAGLGVKVGPTLADIEAIADRSRYILQQRVDFAPVIETPAGPTEAEIRVMYIWLGDRPQAVTTIVRMGRVMGVDDSRDLAWVGASAGFVV